MFKNIPKIDVELERLIEESRNYVMSPEERWEQCVSFVYGQLGFDNPDITKEQVRKDIEIYRH